MIFSLAGDVISVSTMSTIICHILPNDFEDDSSYHKKNEYSESHVNGLRGGFSGGEARTLVESNAVIG